MHSMINAYKASLMTVSFMTYVVMAGLLTQIGVITGPMAQYLDISVTHAASLFSYLTGGTLVGTFIAMIVYSKFQIKLILRLNYLVFLLIMLSLVALDIRSSLLISFYLFVLGMCCGTGLSGGAVIITKIFEENQRASAFISTDCAFSAAGFVFPTTMAILLSNNIEWTLGYALVGLVASLIFASTFALSFPSHTDAVSSLQKDSSTHTFKAILSIPVMLVCFALCMYLIAQSTFLIWAPRYLQDTFSLSFDEAAAVLGNYWGPSVFGLILSAIIVNKIPTRPMLLSVLLIAIAITFFLCITKSAQSFLCITLFFGFFTSCIFKLAISVGSQQIRGAPTVLVTFLITSGTIGSTLAPVLSAQVVEKFGVASAMTMTFLGYLTVGAALSGCLLLERLR